MTEHDWSPQQQAALRMVEDWYRSENAPQVFRLFGYAGTGKTTLALAIADMVRGIVKESDGETAAEWAVTFAAFTGKAASVLRQKGCRGASTIHGLIYITDEEAGGVPTFVLNPASALKDAKLCVIDECSMVGAELAHDLLSFGVKVLVLGDPAQLPPVQDAGFFTNHKPDHMGREAELQREERKESDEFTWGYTLTVHKSQGSQWDDVMLFDESRVFGSDANRWLYTGVTRAAKTLTVVM